MENKNLPEIEEFKKPKLFTKGFFVGLIITLIITSLIGGLVILQEVYVLGKTFESQGMVIMIDAFSVSGGLVCLFYLLCFVHAKLQNLDYFYQAIYAIISYT